MKYLLIGDTDLFKQANGDNINGLELSGLFLWSSAFKKYGSIGDIEPYWRIDDLEKYDIVHVNYTPSNVQIPMLIKQELKDSSTKLVLNVDLDVSKWSPVWANQFISMIHELKLADIVFHVEPMGQIAIQKLTGVNVHLCPHPVDVSSLYDHILPLEERENIIGTIFHKYTLDSMTQYLAQKDIPIRKVLFGVPPVNKKIVAQLGMYDQLISQLNFQDYIKEIVKSRIGCDLYDGYSYGRAPIEFAALGIPSVVSNRIGSSWLFPYTVIDPYNINKAHELFTKLLTDDEFTNKVIKTAHEKCSYYSLKNSYDRFIEMVEE